MTTEYGRRADLAFGRWYLMIQPHSRNKSGFARSTENRPVVEEQFVLICRVDIPNRQLNKREYGTVRSLMEAT
jgi:hypothetical protein